MSQVLHPIEHKIIKTLKRMPNLTYEELAKNAQLAMDQVRRGIEWLKYKNLVESESNRFLLMKIKKISILILFLVEK